MKKRRVIALLLTLSLVVSMNSLTVLATGPDMPNDSGTIEEGIGETAGSENPTDGQQTGGSTENNASDGQAQDVVPGGEEGADNPGGDDVIQDDGDDVESPDEGNGDVMGDGEAADPDAGNVSEEPEEAVEGTEADEGASAEETSEVKIVTFTDSSGLKITYDAIAAVNFEPTINDEGILTAVSGVEGVVDLRDYDEIASIGSTAFSDNKKITYVMLPKSVKSIMDNAFSGCTALKGVSIPSRLETVGEGAFMGCTSLTQLALPNSVVSIGANAFKGDSRLFMVHMVSAAYSKLETIGNSAFEGCISLELFCSDEEYNLPASVTTIGEHAFEGCKKINYVTMSDNITTLGQYAYKDCSGIKEINLSSGLAVISAYAFAGCTALEVVNFGNDNVAVSTEIAGYAFQNCSSLNNLELPDQINKVCSNAFNGCTALRRIEIDNTRAILEDKAFPNDNRKDGMCIVSKKDSTAFSYAEEASIRFIATNEVGDEFYTYQAKISGDGTKTDPKITVKVTTKPTYSFEDKDINDIDNGANTKKGVKAGTICYFYYEMNGLTGIQLVSGSVKVNGVPLKNEKNTYSFAMPVGGATITAEFEYTNHEVVVDGNEETIEGRLSSEANYDAKKKTGYLKVGQSAKFYLTNAESRIPVSKVTYGISPSSESGVVSIDANGTVKALKVGTAVVSARVRVGIGDNDFVYKFLTVQVEKAGIDHISMLVPRKDSYMTVIKDGDKITGLSVPTEKLSRDFTFDLQAVAFSMQEDSEEMAVAFTWTTSDAKVAKLAKSSTAVASSVNTITIPKNTDGEATITVTATDENKNKITQKFVISAQSYQPRLTQSKITVNPNQVDNTTKLEIISAYGKLITPGSVQILDAKTKIDQKDFAVAYMAEESRESVSVFGLSPREGIKEASYSVLVKVKVSDIEYEIPLTIVVKKSIPNPTVSFDKKKPKINLFYKNDGTEIAPVISKLGTEEVSSYSLEALTEPGNKNYDNDKLFLDNFEINKDEGIIKQKSLQMLTNTSKKPVLTGYLVLRFKNYKEDVVKKYKITIPTETVAPSYVLNKASATYNMYCSNRSIELQLLDKRNKNAPVVLDKNNGDTITIVDGKSRTRSAYGEDITEDGKISFAIDARPSLSPGKVYLKLTNDSWTEGKYFTYVYTIKTNSGDPTLTLTDGPGSLTTLKKSTLTINPNYKDQIIYFGLKSNQDDTKISKQQVFKPQSNDKNKAQYDKLSVTYENGVGQVSLKKGGEDIAGGTYTFVCEAPQCTIGEYEKSVKKVTLKVKVAKSNPTVTAKGSLTFNAQVKDGNRFIEEGELTLTAKNLPGNYKIDEEGTLETIACTTKNYADYEKNFDWSIVQSDDNPLIYSLKVSMNTYYKDGTFKFSIKPKFTNKPEPADDEADEEENTVELAKAIAFSVKVYRGNPTISLSAKGKLNLLDREPLVKAAEYQYTNTTSNSIVYTPTIKNVKDTIDDARVYDANDKVPECTDEVSKLFKVKALDGKLYVSPKEGVQLENNKTYKVAIWMKLANYNFGDINGRDQGGTWSNTLSIKSAQVLPKVTTDKSEVNLYLSNKNYEATFTVNKKDIKSIGEIESIAFGENDTKALESFVTSEDVETGKNIIIDSEPLDNGSLKVKLKIKNGVAYGCNTTNKITMYVRFKDQGSNTAGTAITMKVKINK